MGFVSTWLGFVLELSLCLPWPDGIDEHYVQYSWYKPCQTKLDTVASVSGLQSPISFTSEYTNASKSGLVSFLD